MSYLYPIHLFRSSSHISPPTKVLCMVGFDDSVLCFILVALVAAFCTMSLVTYFLVDLFIFGGISPGYVWGTPLDLLSTFSCVSCTVSLHYKPFLECHHWCKWPCRIFLGGHIWWLKSFSTSHCGITFGWWSYWWRSELFVIMWPSYRLSHNTQALRVS